MAEMSTPLQNLDPADAWAPWRPTASDPWGPKWAAHLYRRAAFGASREELLEAERLGFERTVALLLDGRANANETTDTLVDAGRVAAECDESGEQLQAWWLYAMLEAGHPVREKLTLFWHNHFATSLVKVHSPRLMFDQNCLLRAHALGNFSVLLQAIGRDPAMLIWLDSNSNVRGKPNENYARELMELFSLGVGHYTETDVREGARAFTGWHTDGVAFTFAARSHDDGSKTFLGRTGRWDGSDVVRIILDEPQTARFVVRKLYRFLISETDAPPDTLLEPLCDDFRKSGYEVSGVIRTMLSSRLFFSSLAFRKRVKGPVEYVLGAVRAVYQTYAENAGDYRPLNPLALARAVAEMGQSLFEPPNVKGWPGGTTWLNTATVLERDNFAGALAMGTLWPDPVPERPIVSKPADPLGQTIRKLFGSNASPGSPPPAPREEPEPPRAFDAARIIEEDRPRSPAEIVDALLELYVPGDIRAGSREKLVAFVADGKPTGRALARRVREAVHAVLTLPEYQLA